MDSKREFRSLKILGRVLLLSKSIEFPSFSANKNFYISRLERAFEWELSELAIANSEIALAIFEELESLLGDKRVLYLKGREGEYKFIRLENGNSIILEDKPDDEVVSID